MSTFKSFAGIIRLPFLILTPACVLLGLGVAVWLGKPVDWLYFAIVMVGAIASHICVNSFNEYFDFKSGLDEKTIKTPFSGGSGTLPANPEFARTALIVSWTSFFMVAAVGIFFCIGWNWTLLPWGLAGMVLLYAYTKWFTRNPVLCLLVPGLGFGVLMVNGSYFALTGEYALPALLASLIPFFLVANLLLLNQFPDVEADRTIGRRHFPITIGRRASSVIYNAFLLGAYADIGICVALGFMPLWSLLGLATLVFAIPAGLGAFRNADNPPALAPSMGMNVLINILTPVLVAVGLFIG